MKRLFGILAFLLLVTPGLAVALPVCTPGAVAGPSSAAGPTTVALVFVNDTCFNFSDSVQQINDKVRLLSGGFTTAAGFIQFHAVMNSDPFINFGATTTNLVPGPVTYTFLFGTPIVPGFYNHATATGGVTVTNGLSGTSNVDVSAIAPTYIQAFGTLGAVPTNLGVDLGSAPCTAGPGPAFTVTNTCPQGTLAHTFTPGFFDNLEVMLTYTQTDNFSVASWSGAATLSTVVPEPASMGLLAIGAVLVALGYRAGSRRQRV
jgi:hypothetical protein